MKLPVSHYDVQFHYVGHLAKCSVRHIIDFNSTKNFDFLFQNAVESPKMFDFLKMKVCSSQWLIAH